jgi:hypothetical protein
MKRFVLRAFDQSNGRTYYWCGRNGDRLVSEVYRDARTMNYPDALALARTINTSDDATIKAAVRGMWFTPLPYLSPLPK